MEEPDPMTRRSRSAAYRAKLRLLSAAVVALPVLANIPAPVRAQEDERADLKIEMVNVPIANDAREVQFRVTNVSSWWADETTAHVATVSPTAGNVVDVPIENLDPGQSTTFVYTLAEGCAGQAIRAEVAAARNYAGVLEANLQNNRIQAQVCQPQAPVAPKPQGPPPVIVGIDPNKPIGVTTQAKPTAVILPPAGPLAAGKDKVLVREPSATGSVVARQWSTPTPLCYRTFAEDALLVGYFLRDGFLCQDNQVYQTMLSFDLSDFLPIYGAHKLLIGSATLSWTDLVEGPADSPPSCVVNLSLPTEDWSQRGLDRFIATEDYADAESRGSSQWDVLHGGLVASWMTDPVAARRGIMLRGPFEDIATDNGGECVSRITEPRLRLVYTVLP